MHELLVLLTRDLLPVVVLAEERDDRDTGVTADDGDRCIGGTDVRSTRDEACSTHDVECGDTEETTRVEDTGFLEDRGDDGYGRVDGVGDDKNVRFGRDAGDGRGEVTNDGCVRLYLSISSSP